MKYKTFPLDQFQVHLVILFLSKELNVSCYISNTRDSVSSGVCIAAKTLPRIFDISFQSKQKLNIKRKR